MGAGYVGIKYICIPETQQTFCPLFTFNQIISLSLYLTLSFLARPTNQPYGIGGKQGEAGGGGVVARPPSCPILTCYV